MPWTVASPPRPAKNWTEAEKKKCVKAANAALRDGSSEQDAIFACIRAAGKSTRKEMDATDYTAITTTTSTDSPNEGQEEKERHVRDVWVPWGVTSFAELDQAIAAQDIVEDTSELMWQFRRLTTNVLNSEDVEDKSATIRALVDEFEVRLDGVQTKEQGFIDSVVEKVKSALSPKKELPALTLYKNANDEWIWFARYSNKWRDDDHPPEIIAERSHKSFIERVNKGLVSYPELWLWHVPGTAWGKAKWVGYDESGFALAAGVVHPKYRKVAEVLKDRDDILLSHGMPLSSIKRDEDDPTVIIEHDTKEISVLPDWAAANKMTSFVVLKEFDMDEMANKGISAEDREKLNQLGVPDESITALEEDNKNEAAKAQEQQIESKEANEAEETETVEEDATEATEVVEEEAAPEVDETEPEEELDVTDQILSQITELGKAMGNVIDSVVALKEQQDALQNELQDVKKEQVETAEKMADTPLASRSDWLRKSIIGDDAARVDGRTSLAKDGPKEESGSDGFFFQKEGWT